MLDISKWPISRIMQLPDDCFGTKFPIIFSGSITSGPSKFFTSELSLPDRSVLHSVEVMNISNTPGTVGGRIFLSLALSTNTVVTDAQFAALDNLLPGIDEIQAGARAFRCPISCRMMRIPVPAQGRKVVARVRFIPAQEVTFVICLVFSSIPAEIPDFYAGFPEDKLDEMIRLLRLGVKFPR